MQLYPKWIDSDSLNNLQDPVILSTFADGKGPGYPIVVFFGDGLHGSGGFRENQCFLW